MLFWYQILKILLFDMRNERVSVVVGIVGMCITGCLLELWVTLFAGRGKTAF